LEFGGFGLNYKTMDTIEIDNLRLNGIYYLKQVVNNTTVYIPIIIHSYIGQKPIAYVLGCPMGMNATFVLDDKDEVFSGNGH
jgi:hypothetical protein